jgi:hydroxyethylthiazole kinase-like uncharacterized protein yjeF
MDTQGSPSSFGQADAAKALPVRAPDAHKRKAVLLLVAGSTQYLGAALLCARAAYRSGAGLVRLALPSALAPAAMQALPELVVHSLSEDPLAQLLELSHGAHAAVVGPGLGRSDGTQALAAALWSGLPVPTVFDADGLHGLRPAAFAAPRVLTPHEGELLGLMGPRGLDAGRPAAALALAEAFQSVALLKGPGTLVARPDGRVSVNSTGSAVLASAGTGDVLSGLIGALMAQGADAYDAARLGAWVHGRAGDRWASANAGRGLLAGDLADGLPAVLHEIGA